MASVRLGRWSALAGLAMAAACGGSSPATPIGSAVNGVWSGTAGGSTFSVDIHSIGESGVILGTGTVAATATRPLSVEGSYVAPDVSLHFVATNYSVFLDGKITGASISGTLQGSAAGFSGQAITLTKH